MSVTFTRPRLCVITITFNSAEVLPEFLESVDRLVAGNDRLDVDIVAADSASSDDTLSILEGSRLPVHVVASPTNDGYAAGINRAVERCPDADAYLVLNPDTRLHTGAVAALLRSLELPGVGIVVPRMVRLDGAQRYSLRRRPSVLRAWAELLLSAERAARIRNWGDRVGDHEAYLTSGFVDWASGSAMLISSRCLRATGPWDERFFLYSEETDFCLRARRAGFRTYYESQATITHLGGGSRLAPELHALLTLNRIRCFRKHHGRIPSALYATPIALKQLARRAMGRATARAAVRSLFLPSARHPELQRIERSLGRPAKR